MKTRGDTRGAHPARPAPTCAPAPRPAARTAATGRPWRPRTPAAARPPAATSRDGPAAIAPQRPPRRPRPRPARRRARGRAGRAGTAAPSAQTRPTDTHRHCYFVTSTPRSSYFGLPQPHLQISASTRGSRRSVSAKEL